MRRRSDGFHDIHTLFERVDLCDELSFKLKASGIRIVCSDKKIPTDERNLCFRAAKLLQKECSAPRGVEIILKKRIPVEAGLGGGSSNAATTLVALNKLWKLGLSQKKLLKLAASIGSDVAFFILNASYAEACGRGEKLKVLRLLQLRLWHVIVKPPFGISTKQAYQSLNPAILTPQKANVKMLVRALERGESDRLQKQIVNDLEVPQNKRVRTILKIKEELLRRGAFSALMSGSGSSVFGLFQSQQKARKVASFFKKSLRKRNKAGRVFVASTL